MRLDHLLKRTFDRPALRELAGLAMLPLPHPATQVQPRRERLSVYRLKGAVAQVVRAHA